MMAQTTVFKKKAYESQRSSSPKQSPANRVSTEFKCRY